MIKKKIFSTPQDSTSSQKGAKPKITYPLDKWSKENQLKKKRRKKKKRKILSFFF